MTATARSRHETTARDGDRLLEVAACSDQGPVRQENQDAWAIRPLGGRGTVVVLADGMGGHADGAVAAYLAVTGATDVLSEAPDPHQALGEAIAAANAAIAARRGFEGAPVIGTTLIAAVVSGSRVSLASVGDSRAYLVRAGVAHQITQDHSYLAEQVRSGQVPPQGVAGDPRRNMLTRALTGEPVEADGFTLDLVAGDTVLLCSDGVWDAVDDAALAAAMAPTSHLGVAVEDAVARALAGGTTDNATVVACRVTTV